MSYISENSRVRNFKSAPCCAFVRILKLLARLVVVIVRLECNTGLIVLINCSYLFHGTFTDDKWIKMALLWNVKGELINNPVDPVGNSDFFFVPSSCHVDQFTFHISTFTDVFSKVSPTKLVSMPHQLIGMMNLLR